MTTHETHMKLVDAVNSSKTEREHEEAYHRLHGWRDGVRDMGIEVDMIAADLEQFGRGFENRPMCCGMFSDWKPADNGTVKGANE